MNWELLKNKVYDWDGSWRDIYVLNTTIEDWEKLINFLNESTILEWYNINNEENNSNIDFSQIKKTWESEKNIVSTAKIFIKDKIQVNLHFFSLEEIEFDIDPREFNSIEDHNDLIRFLIDISISIGKKLIITPENHSEYSLITVDEKIITINSDLI